MQIDRFIKCDHWSLPAGDQDGVKTRSVDVDYFFRIGHKSHQARRIYKTHTDEIACGIAAGIAGVAHRVALAFPAVRAENLDLITFLCKFKVGMAQFAPPESDWPARSGGNGSVGNYNRNSL